MMNAERRLVQWKVRSRPPFDSYSIQRWILSTKADYSILICDMGSVGVVLRLTWGGPQSNVSLQDSGRNMKKRFLTSNNNHHFVVY